MKGFRLTSDAQSDLIEIRHYTLHKWGAEQSKKYIAGLLQSITTLSDNLLIGTKREDIFHNAYSFPHGMHMIYYLEQCNKLIIFAVLHQTMVPQLHLENRQPY